jgi:hypothetical protein
MDAIPLFHTAGDLAAHAGLAPASVTGLIDRLDQAMATRNLGTFFQGLEHRLADLYTRYSDDQLELLLEFLLEIAARQHEATAELTDADG